MEHMLNRPFTMKGHPEWLIYIITTTEPSLESTTGVCVSSDNTSDDTRENEIETTHKKPTSKKSLVVLPYIQGVLG